MRQRELEIRLQTIPPHPSPRPDLEQYATPAPIAADFLYRAFGCGDVAGRRVLDLGCGTGTFAIGAALLGAAASVGVDVDADSLAQARQSAQELGADVEFVEADVESYRRDADTVLMNPPFGAQRRGADRPFLKTALACAPVVYSLHLSETLPFLRGFVRELGADVVASWTYDFPLRWQFRFHEKPVTRVPVAALRIVR